VKTLFLILILGCLCIRGDILFIRGPIVGNFSPPADTACGNMLLESGSKVLMEDASAILFECSSLPANIMKEDGTSHIITENSNNIHSEAP
jgi:hypothetical protein